MNLLWPILYLFTNILMILCFNSANFNLSFLKFFDFIYYPAPPPVHSVWVHCRHRWSTRFSGGPPHSRSFLSNWTNLFSSLNCSFSLGAVYVYVCVYSMAGKKEGGRVVCLTWTVSC